MRYALFELNFENGQPVFKWAATDMSLTSAEASRRAWNYQAMQKGGYIEVIEDSQEAFDARKAQVLRYHPRCSALK